MDGRVPPKGLRTTVEVWFLARGPLLAGPVRVRLICTCSGTLCTTATLTEMEARQSEGERAMRESTKALGMLPRLCQGFSDCSTRPAAGPIRFFQVSAMCV